MSSPTKFLVFFLISVSSLSCVYAQELSKDVVLAQLGHQAYQVIANRYVLNPTARFGGSGKSLPRDGTWTIGKSAPKACPNTTESCVGLLYKSTSFPMSCQWVVLLNGEGTDGTILEQNEDASRYFIRRISVDEARELIQTFERPAYPPAALKKYVQGTVTVSISVSAQGVPERVTVLEGPKPLFGATVDALQRATFKPYQIASGGIPFQTTFHIRYDAGDKKTPPAVTGP